MKERYHHQSVFGAGRRAPLCREKRAQFVALLPLHRRVGRLTPNCVLLLMALLKLQGSDGRLDPTTATLAELGGMAPSTVQENRNRSRDVGFLDWERRLIRERDPDSATGWRTRQTSNAYVLLIPGRDADTDFRRRVPTPCKRTRIGRIESIEAEQEAANRNRDRQLALLLAGAGPPDG